MSCKYCDIKMRPLDDDDDDGVKVLKGENWKGDKFGGDGGYIGQSYDDKFRMVVYYDAGYACTQVPDVKFCPFCGAELTMPAEPLIKDTECRKIMRLWADRCGVKTVTLFGSEFVYGGKSSISFGVDFGLEHLKLYTIDELCGEEEE